MSTFTPFPRLAPKIRAMVKVILWKEFLDHESHNRIALVHRSSLRIIPSKCLIIPLIATNRESRELALERYNLRFDIFRPILEVTPMEFEQWATRPNGIGRYKEFRSAELYYHYVHEVVITAAKDMLHTEQEGNQIPKDCIHLSSLSDKFLLSPTETFGGACVTPFAYDKLVELLGPNFSGQDWAPQRHLTAKLPPSACALITNIVHAPFKSDLDLKDCSGMLYYSSSTVQILWLSNPFCRMRSPSTGARYFTLENTFRGGFTADTLVNKMLQEGAKSLSTIELQSKDDKRDPNHWRLWRPSDT
ncbi:hypothetical protein PG994_009668 [Apiospora phragmitis]|uniref:Uncharacterized protein n=1 Tax=Apiospora phragmitis TaxID=2905665 RepID=A0ABR1U6R5_9PEZI